MYLSNPHILLPPERNKPMKLYTFASNSTIGGMLAQKDCDGIERSIYYLSRVLNDIETIYIQKENCAYAYTSLVKKLKYYMKPTNVFVCSHFNVIKHIMSKPILHSRIGKWTWF